MRELHKMHELHKKGGQPKPSPPVMNPGEPGNYFTRSSTLNSASVFILAHSSWITGCQMPLISVNGLYCFLAQSLNSDTSLSVKSLNSFIILPEGKARVSSTYELST